jgi:pimeloyl-ACP methyl ester carboxylesterase
MSARRFLVFDLPGGRCVGTAHDPAPRASRLGLLWVNFGYVPRDGHGGLATQACEAMAARGVPCYRFDLPGLGDAPGPLLAHTQQFFPFVTSGGFTEVTTQLVKHLCATEGLDGVVMGGLCGGAVNAIYTGDKAPDLVKGLVLLEPEMYVTEPKKLDEHTAPDGLRSRLRRRLPASTVLDQLLLHTLPGEAKLRAKLFSYWGWMRFLTYENEWARMVPLPRKAILDFVLSRSGLPEVTNLPLASAWQRWVQAGRPVLTITAEGKLREVFFDRINATVLAGVAKRRYAHVRLSGTNHIFTTGGAIETVTGHLERSWAWLA